MKTQETENEACGNYKVIKVQNRLWQMISTDGKSNGKQGQQIKIPVAPSHQGGSAPRIFFPAQESII